MAFTPAIRLGVLCVVVLQCLPVPVVHSHEFESELASTVALNRHIAMFHGGRSCEKCNGLHVHFVPPSFFAHGDAADATGSEAPPTDSEYVTVTSVALPDAGCVGTPFELVSGTGDRHVDRSESGSTRHFLQTFPANTNLGGLIGVCLC